MISFSLEYYHSRIHLYAVWAFFLPTFSFNIKYRNTTCIPLTCFVYSTFFEIYPSCCIELRFIYFHCQIVISCRTIPQSIYPYFYWRIFGLFPHFGWDELEWAAALKFWHIFLEHMCKSLSSIITQERNCGVFRDHIFSWTRMQNGVSKWFYHLLPTL